LLDKAQSSLPLDRSHNQSIVILSIGTFLEYFDLMLYVHMAIILNELFFPKTDPAIASLISSAAFCTTYFFRPIGALIFGWIGDNIGRKVTVLMTIVLMSFSCILMANLPTYAQIGISASWLLVICRIIQGISSMGEIIGAELYITETIKAPMQYPAVALIETCFALGGMAALGIATFFTTFNLNWRFAFWLGALLALVGSFARTRLRETPEFIDSKRKIRRDLELAEIDESNLKDNHITQEKVDKKTLLALFLMDCSWPACFYIAYIYCGDLLKDSFGFSGEQVIHQNFIVSIVEFLGSLSLVYLSSKIYPLKILKVKLIIFMPFILLCPYLFDHLRTSFDLLLIQSFIMLFGFFMSPAFPIFYRQLPVFRRFTYASLSFALSRALIYTITSFGLIYLVKYFGNLGLLILLIPISIGFAFGVNHFEKLDAQST
jgi:MFS family permease